MKAKHKYILTLSTLALFVISVFIGYFISTRSISKAMKAEGGGGGGCPIQTCSKDEDCPSCDYKVGRCEKGTCVWPKCGTYSGTGDQQANNDCVPSYCCDYYTNSYLGSCFTSIYSDDKYLCAPK
jgi:hypothetical protein